MCYSFVQLVILYLSGKFTIFAEFQIIFNCERIEKKVSLLLTSLNDKR